MHTHVRWLVTVCFVAACASSATEMQGAGGDKAAITVSLRVKAGAADGSNQRVLMPADQLKQAERIALDVDVDRPAAVYVAQRLPDGKLELLAAQPEVRPERPLRLPPLEPDGNTPEEELFVVASTRPFTQLESELCSSLKRSPCSLAHDDSPTGTRGSAPPPPPPPPPPRNVDVATRTLGDKGYSLVARSDQRGVAVLHFVLRHQR